MKKAYIFDLDNTLFNTHNISDELFAPVYKILHESGQYEEEFDAIKEDFTRILFQKIAEKYKLDKKVAKECTKVLKELEYNKPIKTFDHYEVIKRLPGDRFLVTSGFMKMQQSKIKSLGIVGDFKEVHVIDNTKTGKVKKDVFEEIINRHGYKPEEVLVIGDDPDSEIKGGNELNIETVLYNRNNEHVYSYATFTINNMNELLNIK